MNRTLYACAAEACAFTHNKWPYRAHENEFVQHIIIIKMNNMDFVWAQRGRRWNLWMLANAIRNRLHSPPHLSLSLSLLIYNDCTLCVSSQLAIKCKRRICLEEMFRRNPHSTGRVTNELRASGCVFVTHLELNRRLCFCLSSLAIALSTHAINFNGEEPTES